MSFFSIICQCQWYDATLDYTCFAISLLVFSLYVFSSFGFVLVITLFSLHQCCWCIWWFFLSIVTWWFFVSVATFQTDRWVGFLYLNIIVSWSKINRATRRNLTILDIVVVVRVKRLIASMFWILQKIYYRIRFFLLLS